MGQLRWQTIFVMFFVAAGAAGQTMTTTTNGGSANTIPIFTTGTNVENSVITQVNGNIGIGTTTPSKQLFVGNGSGATVGLSGIAGTSYHFELNSALGNYLQIMSMQPGAVPFAITGSGSVGIGTLTPQYQLDVVGQIRSTSGGVVFPDGSTQTTAYTPSALNSAVLVGNGSGATLGLAGINGTSYNFSLNTQLGNYLQIMSGTPGATPFVITGNGSVGIGTTSPGALLDVHGNVLISAAGASVIFPDNTIQATAWNGVLSGGDYAESVNVSGNREAYEPGDVLVIDPAFEGSFLRSSAPYSTAVTGIYSTKPGVIGRRQPTAKAHMKEEVPMAMTGIVPTKVSAENGPISAGDLLVTSSKLGYAMKGTDRSQMLGAVIGKAIGHLDLGTGIIEAVVTLQ